MPLPSKSRLANNIAPVLDFTLHEKQAYAFNSPATEILYGGAAGGGKSHLFRIAAIAFCLEINGLQAYFFRRIRDDLIKNHMEGPKGFRALLAELVLTGHVKIVEDEIRFYNGSKIYLCHCKDENDIYKYQGAEIHFLVIDELTHFTEAMYRFLRHRLRMVGIILPEKYKGKFPRIMAGANPGGIGHLFVKTTFVDPVEYTGIWRTPANEGGLLRQYIPALLEDNPSMAADDPDYESRLQGLGHPALVRAMRYGDWDVVAGGAFEKWDRAKHVIRHFTPPRHWTRIMGQDWGTARPFSIGWYCVVEGETLLKGRDGEPDVALPHGALVRYREWYGWNGKPNEGCRMESHEVALRILEIEQDDDEPPIDSRIADSAMWAQVDGPSVAENQMKVRSGLGKKLVLSQSVKNRKDNYQECRRRLAGEGGRPMFYVTTNCTHFIRTVPTLILDEKNPEKGPDEAQELHCFDEWSYVCMSRPMVHTLQGRYESMRKSDQRKKAKAQATSRKKWLNKKN